MAQAALEKKPATPSLQPDPAKIMQIGMGFWASKVLLTAVKMRLFTRLSGTALSASQVKEALDLHTTDRHIYDWLDTLTSLGFLQRDGMWESALYSNAIEADLFLDIKKPSYVGGILEMADSRLYGFWGNLEEGLKSGLPQNEAKQSGNMDFFVDLYKDKEKLQEFMDAMSGIQKGNFMTLVKKFDFSKYRSFADIGGADAALSIQVCLNHPGIQCINYDLPPVTPVAEKKISEAGLGNRINTMSGDLTTDALPRADIICMGNVLHGFNEDNKKTVIQKAYNAVQDGGAFIAIENIIDNERKENTFGLLMSLNMLIENGDAFDYTFDDFQKWTKEAGFRRQELLPLTGPASAAIAYK